MTFKNNTTQVIAIIQQWSHNEVAIRYYKDGLDWLDRTLYTSVSNAVASLKDNGFNPYILS